MITVKEDPPIDCVFLFVLYDRRVGLGVSFLTADREVVGSISVTFTILNVD